MCKAEADGEDLSNVLQRVKDSIQETKEEMELLASLLASERSVSVFRHSSGRGFFGAPADPPTDEALLRHLLSTDSEVPLEMQPGYSLDWALWEPNFDTMQLAPAPYHCCRAYLTREEPSTGKPVWKNGQATGKTTGVTNDVFAHRRVAGNVSSSGVPITSAEAAIFSDNGPNFSTGDSGSLVLSSGTDAVIGMVFGGDQHCTISLYTPTKHLLSSISERTGIHLDIIRS